ncbi:MAG: hypothetical protein KY410_02865 [Proteobacteria bacterium]|nr:hypothetical protein [Pseudomonadota bacterium]
MDEKHTLPDDFDPWMAADALKGVTEAMYWFVTEGPGAGQSWSRGTHASLVGLSWIARRLAHELHLYMTRLSEAGIEFPKLDNPGDEEIRDAAGIYALN